MTSPEDLPAKKISAFFKVLTKYTREDNFPCQIEEGLFLGSVGGAYNKQALMSLNITHVLTVADSLLPAFPNDFVYRKIDVLDTPVTNLKIHFKECFDFIDEGRQGGGGVFVHCFAGRSRSATIIIAYLMKRHRKSLSEAYSLVKSKRPQIAPNVGFMQQLQNFEESLGGDLFEECCSIVQALNIDDKTFMVKCLVLLTKRKDLRAKLVSLTKPELQLGFLRQYLNESK